MSPWLGWGISTLLLLFLNRGDSGDEDTSPQQPSKFTDSNVNTIGNPVPVVLGRALIKNPIISYYGDFRADIYTEDYGMHSDLDAASIIWPILLSIIATVLMPVEHPEKGVVTSGYGAGGNTVGTSTDTQNGIKNQLIVMSVLNALITLLLWLFNNHAGRTTIQKGFKYYLGWQHIICWTGENIGIKRLWMDVYDSDVEASTQIGVWDNNSHVAWEVDNMNGITAHIEDEDMFGGVDEGGGFIGDVRFYFGNVGQPKDPWMIKEMTESAAIPTDLKGLTPQYPMYLTCVISNKSMESGAYIGKQATVPEMWFEVVNYPDGVAKQTEQFRLQRFKERLIAYWENVNSFMLKQDPMVQNYMQPYMNQILADGTAVIGASTIADADALCPALVQSITNAYQNSPQALQNLFYEAAYPMYVLASRGVWKLGRLGDDLNPAEAIYEILKNDYWGCAYKEDRIDIESLAVLGMICEDEQIGISCLINRVSQANDYITKILAHINGVKYDDPTTGKLTFKLIRNDYDINRIQFFDESNCESCEFSRLDWSETTSAISLNFTDAEEKYETSSFLQTDISNTLITKTYTEKQVDGEYFTTTANARWMAQMCLLSAGYPLAAINLVTNRRAYNVTIGDPIKVSWEPYGIEQMVFRVTDIDYATLTDGKISITAVEDVFGFDKLDFTFSSTPAWTDPEKVPFDIARFLFIEAPFEFTHSLNTYMYAFAAKPSQYTIYWDIWREVGGIYSISAKSSTWSTVGRLVYGYDCGYAFDSTGFEFYMVGTNGEDLIADKIKAINANPYQYNHTSNLNCLIINDEIMSYDKIIKLPNGHYQVQGVVRGIFDTLPSAHTTEDVIYFIEYCINITGNNQFVAYAGDIAHEQLELKTESVDVAQPFESQDLIQIETQRRSECPSVMANLKLCADRGTESVYRYTHQTLPSMSFDILFSFIGRNKFNSYGILEQTDDITKIDVSTATKNYIKVECAGEEFELMSDATYMADEDNDGNLELHNTTSMKMRWVDFCQYMNNKVAVSNSIVVSAGTYDSDKNLYSYAQYKAAIQYMMPRIVGIVTNVSDVQAYADSLTINGANSIVVPQTPVSPQQTLTFDDCALIFLGTPTQQGGQSVAIGQDGNYYDLSTTTVFRIDGATPTNTAIIHQVDIDDKFIVRTRFTTLVGNWEDYYRLNNGVWYGYTPYI